MIYADISAHDRLKELRSEYHHLIPQQLFSLKTPTPVVLAGERGGFGKDDPKNLLPLLQYRTKDCCTSLVGQHGGHPAYNLYVRLSVIKWGRDNPKFSDKEAAAYLTAFSTELRFELMLTRETVQNYGIRKLKSEMNFNYFTLSSGAERRLMGFSQ